MPPPSRTHTPIHALTRQTLTMTPLEPPSTQTPVASSAPRHLHRPGPIAIFGCKPFRFTRARSANESASLYSPPVSPTTVPANTASNAFPQFGPSTKSTTSSSSSSPSSNQAEAPAAGGLPTTPTPPLTPPPTSSPHSPDSPSSRANPVDNPSQSQSHSETTGSQRERRSSSADEFLRHVRRSFEMRRQRREQEQRSGERGEEGMGGYEVFVDEGERGFIGVEAL
ncbi:hypothetical protein EJ04DRAFT_567172 [Polyplosphaeria fusca]|uniref:Uncharacterized protein n=1 Tax=Polyplosphaeria fusca TaxID=682080 RepID=A0A9P4QTI2_9PLEO|nr:hypothetical protein EJ04DRAFT_567172 [Polyplosphaeria fusca]